MRNFFEGGNPYLVQVFHDSDTNEVVVRTDTDISLSPQELVELYDKLTPIYNAIKNGN